MKSIRALGVTVAALLIGLAVAAPASAHPHYPPVFNGISVSPGNICAHGKVEVKAQTFKANSTTHFNVKVHGQVVDHGKQPANGKGKVDFDLKLNVPGTNKISVWGTGHKGHDLRLSVTVNVKHCHVYKQGPSPTPSSGGVVGPVDSGGSTGLGALLRTGALVGSGLALLVAFGAGLLLLIGGMRRRRSPEQPVT